MAKRIRYNPKLPKIIARAERINASKAKAGYITGGDYAGGKITVKGLARVHEYGVDIAVTDAMRRFYVAKFGINLKSTTTHIRIPERSFIRTGAAEAVPKVMAAIKAQIKAVLAGKIPVHDFYESLGEEVKQSIAEYGRELSNPANSPLTVMDKGFDDPLVRTGNMLDSIEVIVE